MAKTDSLPDKVQKLLDREISRINNVSVERPLDALEIDKLRQLCETFMLLEPKNATAKMIRNRGQYVKYDEETLLKYAKPTPVDDKK